MAAAATSLQQVSTLMASYGRSPQGGNSQMQRAIDTLQTQLQEQQQYLIASQQHEEQRQQQLHEARRNAESIQNPGGQGGYQRFQQGWNPAASASYPANIDHALTSAAAGEAAGSQQQQAEPRPTGLTQDHPMAKLYPSAMPGPGNQPCVTYAGHQQPVRALCQNGTNLYTASEDGTCRQWWIGDGAELMQFKGHRDWVTACVVIAGSLFTSSADGTVREWNVLDGSPKRVYEGHTDAVWCLAAAPGGAAGIYSGGADCSVRLWVTEGVVAGQCTQRLLGPQGCVWAVCCGEGKVFAASDDMSIVMWDSATSQVEYIFRGHTSGVLALAMGGTNLFSGSGDHTIRQWDVRTRRHLRSFQGHLSSVTALCVMDGGLEASPQDQARGGRYLYSGSADMTVLQWDLDTGGLERFYKGHQASVTSICVLPQGKSGVGWLLTGSDDGKAQLAWTGKGPPPQGGYNASNDRNLPTISGRVGLSGLDAGGLVAGSQVAVPHSQLYASFTRAFQKDLVDFAHFSGSQNATVIVSSIRQGSPGGSVVVRFEMACRTAGELGTAASALTTAVQVGALGRLGGGKVAPRSLFLGGKDQDQTEAGVGLPVVNGALPGPVAEGDVARDMLAKGMELVRQGMALQQPAAGAGTGSGEELLQAAQQQGVATPPSSPPAASLPPAGDSTMVGRRGRRGSAPADSIAARLAVVEEEKGVMRRDLITAREENAKLRRQLETTTVTAAEQAHKADDDAPRLREELGKAQAEVKALEEAGKGNDRELREAKAASEAAEKKRAESAKELEESVAARADAESKLQEAMGREAEARQAGVARGDSSAILSKLESDLEGVCRELVLEREGALATKADLEGQLAEAGKEREEAVKKVASLEAAAGSSNDSMGGDSMGEGAAKLQEQLAASIAAADEMTTKIQALEGELQRAHDTQKETMGQWAEEHEKAMEAIKQEHENALKAQEEANDAAAPASKSSAAAAGGDEAADEVERLRGELGKLQRDLAAAVKESETRAASIQALEKAKAEALKQAETEKARADQQEEAGDAVPDPGAVSVLEERLASRGAELDQAKTELESVKKQAEEAEKDADEKLSFLETSLEEAHAKQGQGSEEQEEKEAELQKQLQAALEAADRHRLELEDAARRLQELEESASGGKGGAGGISTEDMHALRESIELEVQESANEAHAKVNARLMARANTVKKENAALKAKLAEVEKLQPTPLSKVVDGEGGGAEEVGELKAKVKKLEALNNRLKKSVKEYQKEVHELQQKVQE